MEEGNAITAEDWPRVAEAQLRKSLLQVEMEACLDSQPTGPEWSNEWQRVIRSELHNSELLESIYQRRRAESRELETSSQNLKSVRRTYGGGKALAGWQSYG